MAFGSGGGRPIEGYATGMSFSINMLRGRAGLGGGSSCRWRGRVHGSAGRAGVGPPVEVDSGAGGALAGAREPGPNHLRRERHDAVVR